VSPSLLLPSRSSRGSGHIGQGSRQGGGSAAVRQYADMLVSMCSSACGSVWQYVWQRVRQCALAVYVWQCAAECGSGEVSGSAAMCRCQKVCGGAKVCAAVCGSAAVRAAVCCSVHSRMRTCARQWCAVVCVRARGNRRQYVVVRASGIVRQCTNFEKSISIHLAIVIIATTIVCLHVYGRDPDESNAPCVCLEAKTRGLPRRLRAA
jgi:hypothetical protein